MVVNELRPATQSLIGAFVMPAKAGIQVGRACTA
jgi:hypothetical protein